MSNINEWCSNLHRGVSMAQSQNNRQLRKDCAAILESMKVSFFLVQSVLRDQLKPGPF